MRHFIAATFVDSGVDRESGRSARLVKGQLNLKCVRWAWLLSREGHAANQLFMHAFVYALCGERNVQMN